jgi:hypothetical protein
LIGDWPSVHYPEYLAIARIAIQIDANPIPMIVEMATLNHIARDVRVKQTDTLSVFAADARINEAIRSAF